MALYLAAPLSAAAAILTSIRPLAFIASAVADGVVPVEILLPERASPHNYSLRPSDLRRLHEADIVVWVGPGMEELLVQPLRVIDRKKQLLLSRDPSILPLLRSSDCTGCVKDSGHHQKYDLHFWLSPPVAKQVALLLHERLIVLFPEQRAKLSSNLHHFEEELASSEQKIAELLAPVSQLDYFVFHDAYGYFESHFGLKNLGHFTINPALQPGARQLHQIRAKLKERRAVCLFAEPQFKPSVIEAVARGTDARISLLDPLGESIPLGRDSYGQFLTQLATQFASCLK